MRSPWIGVGPPSNDWGFTRRETGAQGWKGEVQRQRQRRGDAATSLEHPSQDRGTDGAAPRATRRNQPRRQLQECEGINRQLFVPTRGHFLTAFAERSINWLPPYGPDGELNPPPFGFGAALQPSEPPSQGHNGRLEPPVCGSLLHCCGSPRTVTLRAGANGRCSPCSRSH